MAYPQDNWYALTNAAVSLGEDKYRLSTVDCGLLKIPSGKLVCCDPFVELDSHLYVQIPAGEYQVIVTLADVSERLNGSHIREAYATLVLNRDQQELTRRFLEPTLNGLPSGEIFQEDEYIGFAVDAGTACFVDMQAVAEGMPDKSTWFKDIFETDWFVRMDNPAEIRAGIANIALPLSKQGNNLVLFHSGWGDGFYPVIGGYDQEGNLVNVHIDFFVVVENEDDEDEA